MRSLSSEREGQRGCANGGNRVRVLNACVALGGDGTQGPDGSRPSANSLSSSQLSGRA